jgi:hypothetical protein
LRRDCGHRYLAAHALDVLRAHGVVADGPKAVVSPADPVGERIATGARHLVWLGRHLTAAARHIRPVGGITAIRVDVQDTARRDLRVITPVVLLVIFIILALLLRALVAPLLLIATAVLSFAGDARRGSAGVQPRAARPRRRPERAAVRVRVAAGPVGHRWRDHLGRCRAGRDVRLAGGAPDPVPGPDRVPGAFGVPALVVAIGGAIRWPSMPASVTGVPADGKSSQYERSG